MTPREGLLGRSTRRVLRHYWRIAEVRWWHIAFPMALAVLVSAAEGASFSVLIPLSDGVAAGTFAGLEDSRWVAWVSALLPRDLTASPSRDTYVALALVGLLFGGQFVKLGLVYGRAWFLSGRDERYLAGVREETFGRVLGFGRQYFDGKALGHVDQEITWAASLVELLSAVEGLVMDLLRLLVKVVLVVVISLPLSLSLVVSLSLLHLFHRRMSATARTLADEAASIQKRVRREVLDLLGTIPLVKAYTQEEEARATYGEILETAEDVEVRRRRLTHFHHPVEEGTILLCALVAEGLVLAFAPGSPATHLARFCAFFLVAQQCVPDLMGVTKFRLAIIRQLPMLETLAELFEDEGKYIVASGDRPFEGVGSEIELRDLRFRYDADKEILRGVDAVLPAGQVTAVVGESGAGKTTLADLLARLYDVEPGSILVDGVDIRDFDLKSLRRKLAIVSQDVWLLNRTLRENLTFGLPRPVDDETLWGVLEDVGLRSLFEGQPRGLATELGDRGVRLSGGERQRVALARTLLREPEILILDEATAALDSAVERKVVDAVTRRMEGRTIVVIAHRLSTLQDADTILVMENGRIVERGRWAALVDAGGRFSSLHRAQFGAA